MGNLLDKYLFQAIDAYPYDLVEAIESLNYALSYDEKNTMALCLMGRVHADQLADYEKAKEYYQQALAEDIHALSIYPYYINVLLWNDDFEEASKLIDFALTVKGADRGMLYLKQALCFEYQEKYKMALKSIKLAKKNAFNGCFINDVAEVKERIKGKLPKKKKAKNKKSKSKKKKK